MKTSELTELLALAADTVKRAARLVARDLAGARLVKRDLRRDVKIEADRRLEALIVKELKKYSALPILSEESGWDAGKTGKLRWIVDPLDGSLNFSRGIPINCISLALWEGNKPLLGVVYDFNRSELFTGLVGRGAWLNGRRIRSGGVAQKSKAILCTGFPSGTSYSDRELNGFLQAVKAYKKVRLLGSAALSLAYVACGRADAYREQDIKIWDVAGGLALVLAAGGRIKLASSKVFNALRVKAANARLIGEL
jgi:myo-inositol-1(or 4)-monophosphatase